MRYLVKTVQRANVPANTPPRVTVFLISEESPTSTIAWTLHDAQLAEQYQVGSIVEVTVAPTT